MPAPSSGAACETNTRSVSSAVLPEVSVAVHVTVVVPLGNSLPDGGTQALVSPGQLSEAVPYPLSVTYNIPFVTAAASARFMAPLAIVVLAAVGAGTLVALAPISARALLWLGAFLWPVLDLRAFNQHESIVHDRYLYIPSVGFCPCSASAHRRCGSTAASAAALPSPARSASAPYGWR